MGKVLLIDDELRVIEAIKQRIHWNLIGVTDVFLCNNAAKAREIMECEQIWLVISDIEMPGVDGLTFVRWIKEYDPTVVVMLLTAYPEFEYAREALQLGVQDYILKPVIYKELEEKIKKALKKREETLRQEQINLAYKENKGNFVKEYIQYLLKDEAVYSREEMESIAKHFHVYLDSHRFYVLIWIHVKDYPSLTWEDHQMFEEMLTDLYGPMAEETIFIPFTDTQLLVLLAFGTDTYVDIENIRKRTADMLQSSSWNISCYMSDEIQLSQFSKILSKMKHRDENNVIFQNYVFLIGNRHVKNENAVRWPDYEQWHMLMTEGKFDALKQKIDFDIHGLVLDGVLDLETLMNLHAQLMQCIYRFIGGNYDLYRNVMEKKDVLLLEKNAVKSVEDFRAFYAYILNAFKQCSHMDNEMDIVSRVKNYIDKHIAEKLSRKDIVAYVALNDSYLSRLFRKNTGMSLSDYILQKKILKAKAMLIQTNLSISEISEKLGYDTSAYFIKLFKREVGMSPREYRKETRI